MKPHLQLCAQAASLQWGDGSAPVYIQAVGQSVNRSVNQSTSSNVQYVLKMIYDNVACGV
jgi:hypothetical protein